MKHGWASLVLMVVCAGCVRYTVPTLTEFHPACPDAETYQTELSSILEIDSEQLSTSSFCEGNGCLSVE